MLEEKIAQLKTIIQERKRIVFFTGAGVSTDSGIPDFRSQDGLYNQQYKCPPETIISRSFFEENPEEFYRFYKDKMLILDTKPNLTHTWIAKLEQQGKSLGVITQNIDGLHTQAGSKHVEELHGSILRNYCMNCHEFYDASFIQNSTGIPTCPKCGGMIKPDVVLYEEPLDQDVLRRSIRMIQSADVLIILGTSLVVYPAAGLIQYFQGEHLVLINRSTTPYDENADLLIQASFQDIIPALALEEN